jgi:hypothetical protein
MRSHTAGDVRVRLGVALAFAVVTGIFTAARVLHEPQWPTDFDQLWHAANALRNGTNPYHVVGPGRAFDWLWPLYYPLPAVLVAVPLSFLSVVAARIAFSALAAAILGFALGPRIRSHWPILLSASFIISASRNQWAPVLLAALWVPALGFFATAKPNVGVASLAGQDRRGLILAAGSCLVITVASFVVQPDWFWDWRDAIRTSPHIQAAVTVLPVGPLLALAALRWKRAESRLFLALVLIPHTPSVYDLLLLFFVARSLREALALALLTQCLYWGIVLFGSFQAFDAYAAGLGRAAIYVVYLPVLAAILLRPNESPNSVNLRVERISALPSSWMDAILLSALLVTATFLVWLPLITYR